MKSPNRGQKVYKILRDKDVNISKLLQKLKNVKRTWFYEWMKDPDLDWEHIREIGEHTGINFREYFADMPVPAAQVKEESVRYANDKLVSVQQKYIQAMEKLNVLLEMVDSQTLARYHEALKSKGM